MCDSTVVKDNLVGFKDNPLGLKDNSLGLKEFLFNIQKSMLESNIAANNMQVQHFMDTNFNKINDCEDVQVYKCKNISVSLTNGDTVNVPEGSLKTHNVVSIDKLDVETSHFITHDAKEGLIIAPNDGTANTKMHISLSANEPSDTVLSLFNSDCSM